MKILYISFLNEDIRPGYKDKIHSQCKAFYHLENECFLFIVKSTNLCLYQIKETEVITKQYNFAHKRTKNDRNIVDEYYLFNQFCNYTKQIINDLKPDMVYIRRIVPILPKLLNLLNFIRGRKIYIVYEYPTYPWKKEMLMGKKYLFYCIDRIFYNSLLKRVDLIACYGKYYGNNNKFLELMNGISSEKYPLHIRNNHNYISLIGVAHVAIVHGYDKIIRGLSIYYNDNPTIKVYFHIVGPIYPNARLKELVDDMNLSEYVIFHGYTTGEKLDAIYEECDIGIDCLALSRRDNGVCGSLKSREYLARGIPFVFAGNLDFMLKHPKGLDFILRVPENTEFININDIILFYQNINACPKKIREYAECNLSWEQSLNKIILRYKND